MMLARSGSVSRAPASPRPRCSASSGVNHGNVAASAQRCPGRRGLSGEDLLGEVGEQLSVAAIGGAADVTSAEFGTCGEGDRGRPTAGPREQPAHRRRLLRAATVAQQLGCLLGVERQLRGGDRRRQALDDKPGGGYRERPSRYQDDVERVGGVPDDGGDQLGGGSLRSEGMSIVDDQHHVLDSALRGHIAAQRNAEGIGAGWVVVGGQRREGVGGHRQLGVRPGRVVTEALDQRAHDGNLGVTVGRRVPHGALRRRPLGDERGLPSAGAGDDRRQTMVEHGLVEATQEPLAEDRCGTCDRTIHRPWNGHRSRVWRMTGAQR